MATNNSGNNSVTSGNFTVPSGSLAVGVSSPTYTLDVQNSVANQITARIYGTGASNTGGGTLFLASDCTTANQQATYIKHAITSAGADQATFLIQQRNGSGTFVGNVASYSYQNQSWILYSNNVVAFQMDSTGAQYNNLQPSFLAYVGTTVTNVTGNGTTYTIGNTALTEIFDQNSDFNTNGTFTAPTTARYRLTAQVTITGTTIATSFVLRVVTSNRAYQSTFSRAALAADQAVIIEALADMDAADTATVTIQANGEAGDTDDILGGATLASYFCGELTT